jgi:exopolysaccharide biosynthesis WecB/TagA/CpsF family protein
VLERANENKLRLFLYGSTKNTLDSLKSFINQNYPDVIICGMHVDRFREATEEEDVADIKKINESGAHIVFVGRGCPRQEKWVVAHKNKINAAMMAIGAAFDFHAGTVKRAPKWMQNSGLEWLYRMMQEPEKMWKRNLDTFPLFIYLFFKYKLTGKYKQ